MYRASIVSMAEGWSDPWEMTWDHSRGGFDPGIYSAMEGLLARVACVWVFWGLKKVEGLGEPDVGGSSLNRGSVQSMMVDKAHSCLLHHCWSHCGVRHPDTGEAGLVSCWLLYFSECFI